MHHFLIMFSWPFTRVPADPSAQADKVARQTVIVFAQDRVDTWRTEAHCLFNQMLERVRLTPVDEWSVTCDAIIPMSGPSFGNGHAMECLLALDLTPEIHAAWERVGTGAKSEASFATSFVHFLNRACGDYKRTHATYDSLRVVFMECNEQPRWEFRVRISEML